MRLDRVGRMAFLELNADAVPSAKDLPFSSVICEATQSQASEVELVVGGRECRRGKSHDCAKSGNGPK